MMSRAYKQLLKIYPAEYRNLFGEEMSACFETASAERRNRGVFPLLSFAVLELTGLMKAACAEWIARFLHSIYHSNGYITGRCLPDSGLMRPAGVARSAYSVIDKHLSKTATPIGDGDICVNAHQRFVFASSPRRLLILACSRVLPMHRR